MITASTLLADLSLACLRGRLDPGRAAAVEAVGVVRRLTRYLDELSNEGLGRELIGDLRRRQTRAVVTAGSQLVREVDGTGAQLGGASDLAGLLVDVLRTSRPPMTHSERWAVVSLLQEPLSAAAATLVVSTSAPEAANLQNRALLLSSYADEHDRPDWPSLARLDDAVPSPAETRPAGPIPPADYADRLSLVAAEVRKAVESRTLSVVDCRIIAETGLAVADAGLRMYRAAGPADPAGRDRAAAQAWADLRVHFTDNVRDGLEGSPNHAIASQAQALHASIVAVSLDPGLAGRADLRQQLAGVGQAVGVLPEIAGAIVAQVGLWDRDPGLNVRHAPQHESFLTGPYRSHGWGDPTTVEDVEHIRGLAETATRTSAVQSMTIEQRTAEVTRPLRSAANRVIAEGGPIPALQQQRDPRPGRTKAQLRPIRQTEAQFKHGQRWRRHVEPASSAPRPEPPAPPGPDLGR